MNFKELSQVINSQPGQGLDQLQRLRGKPFWYWDKARHRASDRVTKGKCCFNHIISLPKKDGKVFPLFDYQKLLCKAYLNQDILIAIPNYVESLGTSLSKNHNDFWTL